jgi:RNA-directed DNA polymerase
MEEALGVKYDHRGQIISERAVVRYADDVVAFCESKADVEAAKQTLKEWLALRGLAFAEEKTRIVHLSEGFDFLGFNVRSYHAPKTTRTGWKTLIKPSKKAIQKIRDKLRQEWLKLRGNSVTVLIARLNPIIRGWANYHRRVVAKEVFHSLDCWMFRREVRYVKHTHPHKPRKWTDERYWGRLNLDRNDQWVFGDKQSGHHLLKFGWFPIEYPVLVQGTASPDDPKLRHYWQERQAAKSSELTASKQKIAQQQKGICPICHETLFNGEELHVHHRLSRARGGKNNYGNLQLLHLYCHQQLHALEKDPTSEKQCPGHQETVTLENKNRQTTKAEKKKKAPAKKRLRK